MMISPEDDPVGASGPWSLFPDLAADRSRSLEAEHRALGDVDLDQVRWLVGQGITEAAMTSPWPIGASRVKFDGPTFTIDSEGERALTFRCANCGEVYDLAAWAPRTGKIGTMFGAAFCLGDLDDVYNPGTYAMGGALKVHRDPLAWLRADRAGIVIVRSELVSMYLRNLQRLVVADEAYKRQMRAWLQPPAPTVELLVEAERVAA